MAIDNQFGKGIGLAAGFDLGAQKPLDSRIAVNTIAERDAHVDNNRAYEGMIVFVDETKKNYQLLNGVWVELFKDEQDRLASLEAELRGEGEGSEGGALTTLQANINKVQDNLDDEKERAEQAEAGLQDAIDAINNVESGILAQAKALDKTDRDTQLLVDQEQDRRLKALEDANAEGGAVKEAIDQVQANLDTFEAEQATKEAAQDAEDTRLDQAIKAEATTARAAEKANADEIIKQKDAAQEGTLANQIKVEREAREAADTALDGRVQAIEKSIGNGGDLEKRVKANEDAIDVINGDGEGSIKKAVADLVNGAPEALDTLDELAAALRDNKDVLTAIENTFDGKLATLQADVDKNEADCDAAITTEKQRAEGQEAAIRGEFAAADTKLKSDLQAEIDADVKVEKERAEAAEKAINDEIANMKNADLDGSLANLIADEAARADAAEKANASAIASNTSNIADNRSVLDKLDGSVTTEGSVKKQIKDAVDGITTGDGSIGIRLTAVESKNIEQDAAIAKNASDLNSHTRNNDFHVTKAQKDAWDAKETTSGAQSKADAALQSAKTYADAQDTALHATISSEIDSDVAAEATLRSNADTALSNRIASFEAGGANDISALETNLKAYADQAEADAIKTAGEALAEGLANKADKEHGNHVPATQTTDNKMFLRNDNTWAAVTPENIGAAPTSHGTHVTYASELPKAPGVAAAGKIDKAAREDHIHPLQTTITGNAGTATKLATARTITVKGDATGSVSFDGSADKDLNLTLSNSGVATGSYGPTGDVAPNYEETFVVPQVTVDIKGRVTSATNRTITLPAQTVYENATSSKAGLMSNEDKAKLDGIEANANNYTHPESHPASMIIESTDKKFVSDAEKADWNARETTDGAQSKADTAAANALQSAKKYADDKITALVNGAPEAMDTLKELADALSTHEGAYNGLLEVVGKKTDKTYVDTELGKKVDKVEGSRLVTTAEVAKWDAKAEVSQVNQALTDAKGYTDSEIAKITTGDGSIGTRLTAVETKNTQQDTAITNNATNLTEEINRAKEAEKVLTDNLTAEVTRAKAAEKTNSDAITVNSNAIATNSNAITVLNGDSTVEGSVDKKIADNNIFDTDILTVNALGGIKAGENLNGMTIEEVLKKLLYPYVAHLVSASSSPNGGVFECGNNQTVTEIKATITKKSEPITKVEFVDGSNVLETKTDGIAAGGSVTHSCSIIVSTNNKSFTVNVTDKSGKVVTATTGKFTFVYPYYWGVCANDATIDEAMVKGLTKKVETKGSKGVTYTANFQRAVIAYPASYGNIKKILDPNSFDVTATFTKHSINVTGLDGKSVAYYVYVNSAFTATNFKFTFSY